MSTYITVPTITYDLAAQFVEVGLKQAEAAGVRGVITVVDPAMQMVAFGRADNATPHSLETSKRKADTSASMKRPTAAFRQDIATALENGSGGRLTRIHGGVPIQFDGVHIGGLGIAGGSPEQDAEIAIATLKQLGADAHSGD